jgi:hypothetical protein
MNTRTRVTAIPALLAAGAFASLPGVWRGVAAHGQATPEATSALQELGLPELNLTVTSDTVEGVPESLEAGRYLLTLSSEADPSNGPGGVLILQLPEGMTLDDAMAEGGEAQDGPPAFYYDSILPGGAAPTPDGPGVSVIDLVPGEWIVAGAALSTPPVILTVTGELPADLPEPESNATITLGEMFIGISEGELVAGENLVRIDNAGVQPHFVIFQRVPDGTTPENIEATIQAEMGGTPEAEPVDFADMIPVAESNEQSTGTTMWMPLTLEPGTYAGLCFIPDQESGLPHAAMGMYTVFTVG